MKPGSIQRVLIRIGIFFLVAIGLLGGSMLLDQIPLSAARPPPTLRTMEDFQVWKRGEISGKGTFEKSGVNYTVMFAPAGRYFASGPAAYLFDGKGRFVDWTADTGDLHTVRHHFDLTSGNVRIVKD